MNLERSPLREQLAGAYVLGTLRGPARRRFERAMADSASVREAVRFWEQAFAPLCALPPQNPARSLLPAIEARLGWARAEDAVRRLPWLPALGFAVVAAVSVMLWAPWTPTITPDFAVTLATEEGQVRWQFAVDKTHNWIDVKVVSTPDLTSQQDLELWLLVDGSAPKSLGLISEVDGQRQRIEARLPLSEGIGLAVSVEPPGGSPTGQATGPIIAIEKFPSA